MQDTIDTPEVKADRAARSRLRVFWTRQFYAWHWISSALSLAGILLFAVTGLTLNHAQNIPAQTSVSARSLMLPADLKPAVAPVEGTGDRKEPLPEPVAKWLGWELKSSVKGKLAEWSAEEIYLSLPRPGGDAWLVIDRETGGVNYELTTRGVISYLNDLHKGRHTGAAWSWFIDIFSVATVIFSITGLGLLWVHSRRRSMTWVFVAAGVALPFLLLLFFVH